MIFSTINPKRDQVDKAKKYLSTKDIDALSDNRPSFALRPDLHPPARAVNVPEDHQDHLDYRDHYDHDHVPRS